MNLLEVQSSVRLEKSVSRTLSYDFIQAWQIAHPQAQHQRRDVGSYPPVHPTELWTMAKQMWKSKECQRGKLPPLNIHSLLGSSVSVEGSHVFGCPPNGLR